MEGLKPDDIAGVANARDRIDRMNATAAAKKRGLSGKQLEAAIERDVLRRQRTAIVTAELYEADKGVIARFWSRLFLAGGHWHVSGTLGRSLYGRTIVHELTIKPWGDQVPVAEPTANVLRALSVSTVRDLALQELRGRHAFLLQAREHERASAGKLTLDVTKAEEDAITRAAELAGPATPRRGRHGGGGDFYRGVARDVVRIAAGGSPIYRTLADARGVSEAAARKWIARCRSDGLLMKGRNDWRLGPNLEPERVLRPGRKHPARTTKEET